MVLIRAIIFDICGTLVFPGGKDEVFPKWEKMLKIKGIQKSVFEKHWFRYERGEITEEEFWKGFLGELKINENMDTERLKKALYSINKPNKELIKLASSLKGKYLLFAITNNTKDFLDYQRKAFGLDEVFEYILASYEVHTRKPNLKIYETLLDIAGMSGKECVFIDDRRKNLERARKLGIKTILFQNNVQVRNELKKMGISV